MNKIVLLLCAVAGIAVAAAPTLFQPAVRIFYNPSNSAPLGWYRNQPKASPKLGDYVLSTLPAAAAALAAQRGYLPAGVPLLKRVSAASGQHVCAEGDALLIDGIPSGRILQSDGLGRPLPSWRQCRVLAGDELFLLSATEPSSFDSRYFGPVTTSALHGQAVPIWTWRTP